MATIDHARRALFRGSLQKRPTLTPPWALPYSQFTDTCTRCGDCITACPERVLITGDGGFPTVNFFQSACTFCGACVTACPTGALHPHVDPAWSQTAHISERCLAQHGVYCQSCRDVCPESAIEFRFAAARVPQPRVDASRCSGCGACVAGCPSVAIDVRRNEEAP